jgi:NTP pyrophosphatase (non-canonical NTP hydrolase)
MSDLKIYELNEYQNLAMRTNPSTDFEKNVTNAVLGLCGESGEVADIIKKWRNQGHGLDEEKIIEEIGDVMWYISLMAHSLGYTLSEVATLNIRKLELRYPYGFDSEKSINRNDK